MTAGGGCGRAAGRRRGREHRHRRDRAGCREPAGRAALPVPGHARPARAAGPPGAAALLAAASGTGLHSALDTLEGLGGAGLASPGPQGWAPGHELVRRAVTATMRPAETARCHALLAQALAQSGADPGQGRQPPGRQRRPRRRRHGLRRRRHAASWTGSATARPCGWPGPACRSTRSAAPGRRCWRRAGRPTATPASSPRPAPTSPPRWTASTIPPPGPGCWPSWPSWKPGPPARPAAASWPNWRSPKPATSPPPWARPSRRARSST